MRERICHIFFQPPTAQLRVPNTRLYGRKAHVSASLFSEDCGEELDENMVVDIKKQLIQARTALVAPVVAVLRHSTQPAQPANTQIA